MATVSISHVTGAAPATFDFSSSVGEVVTVTITLLNANGSARDCSGGTLQWEFEARGAQGAPNYFEARGSDTGIHTIEVPFAVARLLGGNYQHDCWYRPASGEREQVCAMSTWNVVRSVGPLFCEPLNIVNEPPVVTLSAPTAAVMQAGSCAIAFGATDDLALTASNFAVVVDAVETADTITLATGSGTTSVTGTASTTLAAGAHTVGIVCEDSGGETDTATASLTAYSITIASPTAGTYDEGTQAVTVAVSPAVAAGTVLTIYDGASLVATGTTGAGATTSQLAAGSHSLTARMTIGGVTITSPAVSIVTADQDPSIAIASPANGATAPAGTVAVTLTVTHPSETPANLTVQVSTDGTNWTAATWQSGNTWTASVTVADEPTTIRARAFDRTSGGTVVNASSVTINAYVELTVTGATFAAITESTSVPTWTCTGFDSQTTLTPAFTFGSSATRAVRVTFPAGSPDDCTTLVVGHLNSFDQNSSYNIGAAYNLAQQNVTAIANIGTLRNLEILACYGNPITALDLSENNAIRYVEAGMCTALASFVAPSAPFQAERFCLEQDDLSSIDLTSAAPFLYDLRAAAQQGGALTITHGGVVFANLMHWCTRDQNITFATAFDWSTQLPVIDELWCWNCGLTGALTIRSTATRSVLAYANDFTSADFASQFPAGRNGTLDLHGCDQLTAVTVTGCPGATTINMLNCGLSREIVTTTLTTVDAFATTNGTLNLGGSNLVPYAEGATAAANLVGRGWSVTVNAAGGVDSDTFTSALGTGWGSLLNDATAEWSASAGGSMHVLGTGSYRVYGNPGDSVTDGADYEVQATITGGTKAAGWFGLVGRWAAGNGVRILFDLSGSLTCGDASGFDANNVSPTQSATFPASWSDTGISSTVRMRMLGTTISVYIDGTLVRTFTVTTNAAALNTSYGVCGESRGLHYAQSMAVVTVPS